MAGIIVSLIVCVVLQITIIFKLIIKNEKQKKSMDDLIMLREAALDISNKVLNSEDMDSLLNYILKTCMSLISKSKFGSILMFNDRGLLVAKASFGFEASGINNFELNIEDSFLYIASKGKMDETMIINRLEDIVLPENIVKSDDMVWAIRSEVSAPLYINEELIGLLCIDGDENGVFTNRDVHILDYMSKQISTVIKKHQMYEEILYLSKYDKQTKLLNRNCFDNEAETKISQAIADNRDLIFVIADLDGLKWTNDNFGHEMGDRLIKSMSDEILRLELENCLISRYGGDEFVALFDDIGYDNILEIFTSLQENLRNKVLKMGKEEIIPSFSFGISRLSESKFRFDVLYRIADERMYFNKKFKKNNLT